MSLIIYCHFIQTRCSLCKRWMCIIICISSNIIKFGFIIRTHQTCTITTCILIRGILRWNSKFSNIRFCYSNCICYMTLIIYCHFIQTRCSLCKRWMTIIICISSNSIQLFFIGCRHQPICIWCSKIVRSFCWSCPFCSTIRFIL